MLLVELAADVCVAAGAAVSGAVAPELFAGFELLVAATVALAVATAVDELDDDDEADAVDVAPDPATGAPAIFIALLDPN
jgi:hypothetical protein